MDGDIKLTRFDILIYFIYPGNYTENSVSLPPHRFKEISPLCAQAGLYLASGPFNSAVRHFGLQLMEHTVKFKWNEIGQPEKLFIKENSMKLLACGVGPAEDATICHIKDALSRVIVEMAKREWPQQWTTLLAELSDASTKGAAQTELVLLVFLRLVEDVALLQTIESNQRRKDIYQALTVNMTEIFAFFLRLIELHVGAFRAGSPEPRTAHSRVVQVVLLTLTGFVEWVSIQHIMAGDGRLLQMLCVLLNDVEFRVPAAECLAQIVNRKGQVKDRKPLAVLFSANAIDFVVRAAVDPAGGTPEQCYTFLKRLLQVLTGLAAQMIALWGKETPEEVAAAAAANITLAACGGIIRPQELRQFLQTVFTLTRHPSLTLTHKACLIWSALVNNEHMQKEPTFVEFIPRLIEAVAPKVIKTPYPQQRCCDLASGRPESFACLDYDSEEEYTIFFHRSRTTILEILRHATLISPLVTYAYCEQWLNVRLSKAGQEVASTSGRVQDPVYVEWEALVSVLDSVLSRIVFVPERPSVQSGLRLLELTLKVESRDPLVVSIVLSCISSLFVFLSMSSCQLTAGNCVAMSGVSLLPRVLEKIFATLMVGGGGGGGGVSGVGASSGGSSSSSSSVQHIAEKNLRRHAAALMVKLGIKYPMLLLPVFDQINSTVQSLAAGSQGGFGGRADSRRQPQQQQLPDQLRSTEIAMLQEALLVISNHFCDYERQSTFVAEVLRDCQADWHALAAVALKSAGDFVHFAGLDRPVPPPSATAPNLADPLDVGTQNRHRLLNAVNRVLGVVRRCAWPDDPDRASRGGFVVALTESGNPIYRNPAAEHVVPLLPHLLALLRVQNELFAPAAMGRLQPAFRNVYGMIENEKRALMGVSPVLFDPMDPEQRRPAGVAEKVQTQLAVLFDNCYHLMGSAGPALGRDLYQLPGIAAALCGSVLSGLEHVPDYRLRPIVRVFLKPFVYSCPSAFYETVLLPIWAHLAPLMLQRLTQKWQYITALYESGELGDDVQNDTQEVFEDMLNRTLTREYLDVIKVALVGGAVGDATPSSGMVTATSATDVSSVATMNGSGGGGGGGGGGMDQDEQSLDASPHNVTRASQSAMAAEVISELGAMLLRCQHTCTPLVLTVLR